MSVSFIRFVAVRYFTARKQEKFVSAISFISLLGIMTGVAALIVVMAVMSGFHKEFAANIKGLNGDITIVSLQNYIKNTAELEQKLQEVPDITRITRVYRGETLAMGTRKNTGALVKAMSLDDIKNKKVIDSNIVAGELNGFDSEDEIAIGMQLAYELGVGVGERLKLISPNMLPTMFGTIPRAREFKIVAVFNSGMYDYDNVTILMPIKAGEKFLGLPEPNLIELNIKPEANVHKVTKIIRLQNTSHIRAISWDSLNRQFLQALATERIAMFAILSLIVIVAAFNIVSSLYMLVKDKSKDISVLQTMGASSGQICAIFIVCGMMIGIIGTFMGLILGLVISYNIENLRLLLEGFTSTKLFDPAIYFLYHLPAEVEYQSVIFVVMLSLVACFLATIYPSVKASRLNPVEALRYE